MIAWWSIKNSLRVCSIKLNYYKVNCSSESNYCWYLKKNEKKEYCRLLVNIGCFTIVLVCFYTRGIGRAQAPDMTLGGVSGTISSSSLYQWNVVSFFTLATWRKHRQHQCFLGGWGLGAFKEHRKSCSETKTEYLAGQHHSALLSDGEVKILCEMRTWKQRRRRKKRIF